MCSASCALAHTAQSVPKLARHVSAAAEASEQAGALSCMGVTIYQQFGTNCSMAALLVGPGYSKHEITASEHVRRTRVSTIGFLWSHA